MSSRESVIVRKSKRLPSTGEVLVKKGDRVNPKTIIAKGEVRNPNLHEVRVDKKLGVDPENVRPYLLKHEGDKVKKDEVLALRRSIFGKTKICRSPVDGTIEVFSATLGKLLIRGAPIPIEVRAHIPGKIVEIFEGEGATIECKAHVLEGTFGISGESEGELEICVQSPDEALTADNIEGSNIGKVIVGGSIATLEALRKASDVGVKGVIVGGVDEKDLTELLGYELGLGITGGEALGYTLILMEGFGPNPMEDQIFELLRSFRGKVACIDGATQIRARMQRPEIIIPV